MNDPLFPIQSSLPLKRGAYSEETLLESVQERPGRYVGGGLLLLGIGWLLGRKKNDRKR